MALTDSLAAYYKFDESSGDAADATGNGNTATNVGTMIYGSGKINNGITGSASTSQRFDLPSNVYSLFGGTSSWSISAWVKPATNYGTLIEIGNGSPPANSYYAALWVLIPWDASGVSVSRGTGGGATATTSNTGITTPASVFTHIVIIHDGATNKTWIYQNASDASGGGGADSANAVTPTMGRFFLFDQSGYTGYGMNGVHDEIGIWSRAITSTEVTTLYNGGAGLQYPFSSSAIKSINGLAKASIKSINGLAIASIKSINGLA